MASTGDSITRAFNDCSLPYVDCPAASWSTGTSTSVNSHYLRIRAANPAITGRNHNDSVTGADMADLLGQVQRAVAQQVEYVTILMGANDVCASSESAMTPVATFRAQFEQAMPANAWSNLPWDVARRSRVRQRNIDYNTQLAQVCGAYVVCRFDNNAVFNTPFTRSDVTTRDYFHPSVAGQAKLASITWAATFDFAAG